MTYQSAKAEFDALIAEKRASRPGMSQQQAVAAVAKEHPELRERVVDEANDRG